MQRRHWATALLIVFGLGVHGTAIAGLYSFNSGVVTTCTGTCDGFAALAHGAIITGTVQINLPPGAAFGDADIQNFSFSIFNPALAPEPFDGTNPTTANPLPIGPETGIIAASNGTAGMIAANHELGDGQVLLELLSPPFSTNEAFMVFNIDANGQTQGEICLFFPTASCLPGGTQAVVFDGRFEESTGLLVDPVAVDFGFVPVGGSAEMAITATYYRTFPDEAVVHDFLSEPFSLSADNCSGQTLQFGESCTVTVQYQPLVVGSFSDEFELGFPGFTPQPVSVAGVLPPGDPDGDDVNDASDNCALVANTDQRDTDADAIGNACDADINNDCIVNFLDLAVYRANFFQSGDLDTDNNGDNITNFLDLALVRDQFFGPPGPSAAGCDVPTTYAIGDTGPGDGIVFYVTDGGLHGLEAAPTDQDPAGGAQWGCFQALTNAAGLAVGDGATNTGLIVNNACSQPGDAAELAVAFDGGGFNDWFLPSRDELDLMFTNLAQMGLGGFDSNFYWSSSEVGGNRAWYQSFVGGSQFIDFKTITIGVRAVRVF